LTSTGTASSIFAYAGEQLDTTGLIYLRARYMNPRLGILLARDPWSGDQLRPGSMNGFNYVEGNPINLTDSGGQDTCQPPYHREPRYKWSKILNEYVYDGSVCVDSNGYPPILRDEALIGTGGPEEEVKEIIAVFGAWCISQLAELPKVLSRQDARALADRTTFEEPISTPTPFPPPGPEPRKEPQKLIWRAISIDPNREAFNWRPDRTDVDGLSGTQGGAQPYHTDPVNWFSTVFKRPLGANDRIVGTKEEVLISAGFSVVPTEKSNDPWRVSIGGVTPGIVTDSEGRPA
jgi:RHS repeat-associated protein